MIWKVKVSALPTGDLIKEINKICEKGWEPFHIEYGENHYSEVYFKKLKVSKR